MKPLRKAMWHSAGDISPMLLQIQRLVKKNPDAEQVRNRMEWLLARILERVKTMQAGLGDLEDFKVDENGPEIVARESGKDRARRKQLQAHRGQQQPAQ
jgi:hypothetical protein